MGEDNEYMIKQVICFSIFCSPKESIEGPVFLRPKGRYSDDVWESLNVPNI